MKATNNFREMERQYLKNSMNINMLIEYCVGNSTIRAFHEDKGHTLKYRPLSIFRTRASRLVRTKRFKDKIRQMGDFERLHTRTVNSLQKYWKKHDGGALEFYHFNKLIDLFFKHLPLWSELSKSEKRWIFRNANVPLDKYSLLKLRDDAPDLGIPKSVTMRHINEDNYYVFQERIRELCGNAPALIFDLIAWNDRNGKEFRLITLKPTKA